MIYWANAKGGSVDYNEVLIKNCNKERKSLFFKTMKIYIWYLNENRKVNPTKYFGEISEFLKDNSKANFALIYYVIALL